MEVMMSGYKQGVHVWSVRPAGGADSPSGAPGTASCEGHKAGCSQEVERQVGQHGGADTKLVSSHWVGQSVSRLSVLEA